MIKTLDDVLKEAAERPSRTIAVAAAEDAPVLRSVVKAQEMGLVKALLFGSAASIRAVAEEEELDLGPFEVVDVSSNAQAAAGAVGAVRDGRAAMLMKGNLQTSQFLSAILDKESGLRDGKNVIAHVAVMQVSGYDRLLLVTDAAMNVAPDLQTKVSIIGSAVWVAHALGIERPKVAALAAVEVVNAAMSATTEAAMLAKMNDRGQIKGCVVDGPLGLDNAVSMEAAKHKGIGGDVAGQADILLAPDLEAGNVLYKAITYLAHGRSAGIIVGARAPVVLTSRSDSEESKLASIALSAIV